MTNGDMQFYKDFHDALITLESEMHNEEGTDNIVKASVQATYDFYDADWAGILIADPVTKMWSPAIWLSRRTGWNSETLFDEYEVFEDYPQWVESLRKGHPVIIEDVSKLTDLSEAEIRNYKKLKVIGVIGTPFGERPTGFMVVKNPRRYKTNPDFAKMMTFVGLSTLYLDELFNVMEMIRHSDQDNQQSGDSVRINLFGVPEIQNAYGSTDATQYKSQQGWELIVYLALMRKAVPSKLIAEKLWPDQNLKDKTDAVRGIRYRFIKNLSYLNIGNILKSSDNKTGYMINTDCPVSIDVWEFEDLVGAAKLARDILKKIDLLKQAVSLYRGTIFQEIADKEWLMAYAMRYDAIYESVVLELLESLDKVKDYEAMHFYALEAMKHMTGNVSLYYWMIRALEGIGSKGMLKNQMDLIKGHLNSSEYAELIKKLGDEYE
ncbi:MAG: BTAD domain-containing putative transcriptional regulator [Eubacteriales bacterium]|nr:BTAD domain-containing putative transcriptional regulator [Eubacteriales bacterium]